MQGVGEAPWGSRAQLLDFCFLDILPSTCEGPCVSGHMGILLVFGDQSERETFSSPCRHRTARGCPQGLDSSFHVFF